MFSITSIESVRYCGTGAGPNQDYAKVTEVYVCWSSVGDCWAAPTDQHQCYAEVP